jgi:hypothetical protein
MSDDVFSGEISILASIDIDGPIAKAKAPICDYFATQFGICAQQAKDENSEAKENIYRFLQALASINARYDTPEMPYGPFFEMAGRRGIVPSDLSSNDLAVIRKILEITKSPAFRARLLDYLWEVEKDHKACSEAALCSLEASNILYDRDDWHLAVPLLGRALHLASRLGWEQETLLKSIEVIKAKTEKLSKEGPNARCYQLMKLLAKYDRKYADDYRGLAKDLATRASHEGKHGLSKGFYEIEAECARLDKKQEDANNAKLRAAEENLKEIEDQIKAPDASPLVTAHLLKQGFEELRRAGAKKEELDALHQRILKCQEAAHGEMKLFSAEVNITEIAKKNQDSVRDKDFIKALFKYVISYPIVDYQKIRTTVIENAQKNPIVHLIGVTQVDGKGRTIEHRHGILDEKYPGRDIEIEKEMYAHCIQFDWSFRVQAYIEPVRRQIFNDHHPTFNDLGFIIYNNPFVPEGHEKIFLRGIHAGFHADYMLASHFLTPQIENSVKHILECNGVIISNINADGTQPPKMLSALLNHAKAKEILSEDLCFEFKGHLIEKSGYRFRDKLAHGETGDEECYSFAAINVWWLVLRACVIPCIQAYANPKEMPEDSNTQEEKGDK